MNLKGIISISGKGGLFKVIGQGKNNVIVQDLESGRKFPAFASNKISALEDISIYTEDDDVLLGDVYTSMFDKTGGKAALAHSTDIEELKKFFNTVLDFDKERVSNADVKKVFQWFNILHKADLLKQDEVETEASSEEE
ncbi:MAG: hypothetical protein ACI9N1_001614 [Flavobacteriales bacterium]|jgi:hypothetical protein